MHTIITTHSDTTITYDERENKWCFTLRGRDRSAESLAKAKEIIDKPVPKEKAKPFEKISAWFFKYSNSPKKVEVTSIAEPHYSLGDMVWISEKGKRSKEYARHQLFPTTSDNDKLVQTILANERERERLREENDSLKSKLSPLVLPKDE